jgi:hypothetical protein
MFEYFQQLHKLIVLHIHRKERWGRENLVAYKLGLILLIQQTGKLKIRRG